MLISSSAVASPVSSAPVASTVSSAPAPSAPAAYSSAASSMSVPTPGNGTAPHATTATTTRQSEMRDVAATLQPDFDDFSESLNSQPDPFEHGETEGNMHVEPTADELRRWRISREQVLAGTADTMMKCTRCFRCKAKVGSCCYHDPYGNEDPELWEWAEVKRREKVRRGKAAAKERKERKRQGLPVVRKKHVRGREAKNWDAKAPDAKDPLVNRARYSLTPCLVASKR